MSLATRFLLYAYYYGTYPGRAWRSARASATGQAPVMVVFYHRIADDLATPWTMSNATFARQIDWIGRHFEFVSLGETQRRLRDGRNERPAVAITFDDGYAENCTHALPLLVERGIPCTYFVSTHFVLEGLPFGHDLACGRRLSPNTPRQIRDLAEAGVEIGAHTRTHADLGQITDPDRLSDELIGSRQDLEQLTGMAVRYFAFPFGKQANLSPAAFRMARRAGFDGVCSAYGGFNFPGDDPFHLQRIHGDCEMIRLKNWLSVDPRKLRSVERYRYETLDTDAPAEPAGACT